LKLLITTPADYRIKEMIDITHPYIRRYAKSVGADFMCLDKDTLGIDEEWKIHYRIMHLYDLLNHYDRVFNIDSDVLISSLCPSIFEQVPYHKVGFVTEDCGSRKVERRLRIKGVQSRYGDVGWTDQYINTGVFVVSRIHREIFNPIDGEFYNDVGYDGVHLGYLINKLGIVVHELGFRWNHMTMFSENWNGCPSRFDSNVIHYAGQGVFDCGIKSRLEQIEADERKLNLLGISLLG